MEKDLEEEAGNCESAEVNKLRTLIKKVLKDKKMTTKDEMESVEKELEQLKAKSCCPKGWKRFKNNCYGLMEDKKTFHEAELGCNKFEGHLMSFHSKDEMNFVKSILPSIGTTAKYLIGLFRFRAAGLREELYFLDGSSADLNGIDGSAPRDVEKTGNKEVFRGAFAILPEKARKVYHAGFGEKQFSICKKDPSVPFVESESTRILKASEILKDAKPASWLVRKFNALTSKK